MNTPTILWHDYETWGTNPRLDFPVQFAAIRTDLSFNQIGKPINWFSQIPNDYIPHPEACLITGITPQLSLSKGYLETEFAEKIYLEMSRKGTCSAGYNSIRFDDEVTRNLFYRNFLPVYEREYANSNSKWDIIDLVRAVYALRPDSINWPTHETGVTSFKLDMLTKENDLSHEDAHDALSDVKATIAMASLIKQKQPKMFDYYWSLRNKQAVIERLNLPSFQPVIYVSGTISANQGCTSWVLPLAHARQNSNTVIAIDLHKSLTPLIEQSEEELAENLFNRGARENQPGFVTIQINKCPFIAPAKMLTPSRSEELGIDRKHCLDNLQYLQGNSALITKLLNAYESASRHLEESSNVDEMLYARDFPTEHDKTNMQKVRQTPPERFAECYEWFSDPLYQQQLFRYQGRNFPSSFGHQQALRWQTHCRNRFENGDGCLSIEDFVSTIESLYETHSQVPSKVEILKRLHEYVSTM